MKVLIGSSTTKKGPNPNQRRKRKVRKARAKDNKSRLRRKYKKVADVERNESNRKVRSQMGSGKRSRVLPKKLKKDRVSNKENCDRLSKVGSRRLRKLLRFTERMKPENAQISHTSISSSIEEADTTSNLPQESECILIEQKCEVIVIDDDDDNDDTKKVDAEQEESSNLNQSLEEGEIVDSIVEISSRKTENLSSKQTSPRGDSKTPPSLFYEDLTRGCSPRNAPLYETITSNDSLLPMLKCSTRDDVIVIDSPPASVKRKKDKSAQLDDSVIFVDEHIDLEKVTSNGCEISTPIFIPLSNNNNWLVSPRKRKKNDSVLDKVIQPFKKFKDHLGSLYSNTSTPKVKRPDGIFTLSEKKKIQQYNTNTYNPNKDKEVKKPGKRMVIVDGSNIAFGHSLNKEFSVKGLEICLAYFEKMGHEVKAVVPQFRLQKSKSTDPEKLEKLHREGKIVFTPCKNLPGKSATSYDDRFILQLAIEFDAAVVSNDNYRDLLDENPAFKEIIEKRVIGYTWCNDVFILPKDPYGRLGPSLSVILNRA